MARRCERCAEATTISAEMPARPGLRFVWRHPAHAIAFGGGAGLVPVAPGTAGTLLAFPIYWVLSLFLSMPWMLALIALGYALGVWACGYTGRALNVADHGGIVWDEIVAFLLVLAIAPAGVLWQALGF